MADPLYLMPGGVIEFPFAAARHAPVAGEDQGRVIAALLQGLAQHGLSRRCCSTLQSLRSQKRTRYAHLELFRFWTRSGLGVAVFAS
jgi:hypothetical protein